MCIKHIFHSVPSFFIHCALSVRISLNSYIYYFFFWSCVKGWLRFFACGFSDSMKNANEKGHKWKSTRRESGKKMHNVEWHSTKLIMKMFVCSVIQDGFTCEKSECVCRREAHIVREKRALNERNNE